MINDILDLPSTLHWNEIESPNESTAHCARGKLVKMRKLMMKYHDNPDVRIFQLLWRNVEAEDLLSDRLPSSENIYII